jgi:PAS domain S-box-containing protein
MDAQKRKEVISQFTILATILSFVLLLAALFLGLIRSEEATFSLSGAIWLFTQNTGYWFVILFAVLFPVVCNWLTRKLTLQVHEKQQLIDYEKDRVQQVHQFTQQLIENNLEVDFNLSGEDDVLGKSLIRFRDALRENRENNQKLRSEEDQRNWQTEGLARTSEILRNNLHDINQLSFNVLKELTNYVGAIQGGFYLLDDTDKHNRFFNLIAFFAYDRRKFADQRIKWGDGLIGTCAMEKKVIHMKNIPDSYISVTSGLGEANPRSLLIVPMQYENAIYGVLEFASFKVFEASHITLIERVSDSIASTLSAVKTNITTARLLEESKAQTQAMTSHEEEMRQNMEELQATQEEATRQAQRFLQLEDMLNQSLMRAEFDGEGKLLSANSLFYHKFDYDQDSKIYGKSIHDFISEDTREHFREIFKKLKQNKEPFSGYLKHVTHAGHDLWAMVSLICTYSEEEAEDKIILLAMDASEEVVRVQRSEIINEMTGKLGIRFDLDINGNFQDHNHHFMHLLKYTQKDLKALVIFDLIDPGDLEGFNKTWETVISGTSFTGFIRIKTSHGEVKWIHGSFAAAYNPAHEINRILFTGYDVTHEKNLETDAKDQADLVKKQEKMLRDSEKEQAKRLRESRSEMLSQLKETERLKLIHEWITEDSPHAIVNTGHDNRILFFNRAAEKLWDIDRNEVISQDIGILFPEGMEEDELLASFIRPGDQKMTGIRKETVIIDKKGLEKRVMIQLAKSKIENENSYTAFLLPSYKE